jgi:hypothetical protein
VSLAPIDRWTVGYLAFATAMLVAPGRAPVAGVTGIHARDAAQLARAHAPPAPRPPGGGAPLGGEV